MNTMDFECYRYYEVHYIDKKWGYHVDTYKDCDDATEHMRVMWEAFSAGVSERMQRRAMGNFYVDEYTTCMYDCVDENMITKDEN